MTSKRYKYAELGKMLIEDWGYTFQDFQSLEEWVMKQSSQDRSLFIIAYIAQRINDVSSRMDESECRIEKLSNAIDPKLDDPSAIKGGIPIEHAEFDVRVYNCLNIAGVKYLEELGKWTERDLLKLRNFGRHALCNVKHILNSNGLSLAKVRS